MAHDNTNMSISLPHEMKEYVKQRTEKAHYGTPSDYMRSLVREDMKREEQERLEQALLKGLNLGKSITHGTKEWSTFKKGVIESIAKKKK